jgi:uncharacterized protein YjiS (DUF1127 family)
MNLQYALPTKPTGTARTSHAPRITWSRVARRFHALLRLLARRRRARRRLLDLGHLDDRTLRDLGLTRSELGSIASELGGRAELSRRRTDAEVWRSASSRFRTRTFDSSL